SHQPDRLECWDGRLCLRGLPDELQAILLFLREQCLEGSGGTLRDRGKLLLPRMDVEEQAAGGRRIRGRRIEQLAQRFLAGLYVGRDRLHGRVARPDHPDQRRGLVIRQLLERSDEDKRRRQRLVRAGQGSGEQNQQRRGGGKAYRFHANLLRVLGAIRRRVI